MTDRYIITRIIKQNGFCVFAIEQGCRCPLYKKCKGPADEPCDNIKVMAENWLIEKNFKLI